LVTRLFAMLGDGGARFFVNFEFHIGAARAWTPAPSWFELDLSDAGK
jgi:hypothetical protein